MVLLMVASLLPVRALELGGWNAPLLSHSSIQSASPTGLHSRINENRSRMLLVHPLEGQGYTVAQS